MLKTLPGKVCPGAVCVDRHAKPSYCVLAMLADQGTVAMKGSAAVANFLLTCCSQKMGGNMIHRFGYFGLPSLPSKICSAPRRITYACMSSRVAFTLWLLRSPPASRMPSEQWQKLASGTACGWADVTHNRHAFTAWTYPEILLRSGNCRWGSRDGVPSVAWHAWPWPRWPSARRLR